MTRRILVVDDDPLTRRLLREMLDGSGWQVREADDGELALEFLQREGFDLVILDRLMPRLGGLELLKELRRLKIAVPALVISAFGEESLWGQAIGLGAEDYLVKPFKAEEVVRVVRRCLEKRAAP